MDHLLAPVPPPWSPELCAALSASAMDSSNIVYFQDWRTGAIFGIPAALGGVVASYVAAGMQVLQNPTAVAAPQVAAPETPRQLVFGDFEPAESEMFRQLQQLQAQNEELRRALDAAQNDARAHAVAAAATVTVMTRRISQGRLSDAETQVETIPPPCAGDDSCAASAHARNELVCARAALEAKSAALGETERKLKDALMRCERSDAECAAYRTRLRDAKRVEMELEKSMLERSSLRLNHEAAEKALRRELENERTMGNAMRPKLVAAEAALSELQKKFKVCDEERMQSMRHVMEASHYPPLIDAMQLYIENVFTKLHNAAVQNDMGLFAKVAMEQLTQFKAGGMDKLVERVVEKHHTSIREVAVSFATERGLVVPPGLVV